jgi:hypothetical protein
MTMLKNDKCNDIMRKATKTKLPSSKFCGDSGGGKTGVCKVLRFLLAGLNEKKNIIDFF